MAASPPPPHADPTLLTALRSDLLAADYTVDGVAALLGPLAGNALAREQALPAQRATHSDGSAAAVLIRLLVLGDAVDVEDLHRALPTLGLAGAAELGLVVQEGPGVVATCDLRPYAEDAHAWWVASDQPELATGRPVFQDHVLGLGGATTTLATWTPRVPVARALDLGTGSGVQALHLGAHAEQVTATDISERALAFARFNAELNGASWDLRAGSMLEPVAGQRFDLIVSNPPFVITPRGAGVPLFEYRDGGLAGDTLVAELVRSIGDHLEPGAIAQFLGNWEVTAAEDWRTRVRSWLTGTGLDAWVVQRERQDPAQYAETWARDGGHHTASPEFAGMYAAWLDDFATRGVEEIGFGVITLRRPTTDRAPFVDLVDAPGPVESPMGPRVLAGLLARTWLAEHDDDALLDQVWVVAPDVTEERHARPGDTDPSVIQLRQGGGLRRVVRVDTVVSALVSVCDGDLTARAALHAIGELVGIPEGEATASALPLLRVLVADGFVTLAGH